MNFGGQKGRIRNYEKTNKTFMRYIWNNIYWFKKQKALIFDEKFSR